MSDWPKPDERPLNHGVILQRTAVKLDKIARYIGKAPEDAQGLREAAEELIAVKHQIMLTAHEIALNKKENPS